MKILFKTNLDKVNGYVLGLNETWLKTFKDHVPALGTNIEFEFSKWDHDLKRSRTCSFDLGVASISYRIANETRDVAVIVELHMPKNFRYINHGIEGADPGSIAAWEAYFRKYVEGKDY